MYFLIKWYAILKDKRLILCTVIIYRFNEKCSILHTHMSKLSANIFITTLLPISQAARYSFKIANTICQSTISTSTIKSSSTQFYIAFKEQFVRGSLSIVSIYRYINTDITVSSYLLKRPLNIKSNQIFTLFCNSFAELKQIKKLTSESNPRNFEIRWIFLPNYETLTASDKSRS